MFRYENLEARVSLQVRKYIYIYIPCQDDRNLHFNMLIVFIYLDATSGQFAFSNDFCNLSLSSIDARVLQHNPRKCYKNFANGLSKSIKYNYDKFSKCPRHRGRVISATVLRFSASIYIYIYI